MYKRQVYSKFTTLLPYIYHLHVSLTIQVTSDHEDLRHIDERLLIDARLSQTCTERYIRDPELLEKNVGWTRKGRICNARLGVSISCRALHQLRLLSCRNVHYMVVGTFHRQAGRPPLHEPRNTKLSGGLPLSHIGAALFGNTQQKYFSRKTLTQMSN